MIGINGKLITQIGLEIGVTHQPAHNLERLVNGRINFANLILVGMRFFVEHKKLATTGKNLPSTNSYA
jgi:hypothetical protein